MRQGNHEAIRPNLHPLMIQTVDAILEGFMINMISRLKLNIVLRKISDAKAATIRGASNMVVNKVFKNLDDKQLDRLADYFEPLILASK